MLQMTSESHMTPLLNLLKLTGIAALIVALPLWLLLTFVETIPQLPSALFIWTHALLELFAVVIAACIFFVGWQLVDENRPRASLLLACAFLSVALFDAAHLLSSHGMPAFVTENSPQKTGWFWLVSRYIASIALLLYFVSASTHKPLHLPAPRHLYLTGTLLFTAAIWLPITLVPDSLPPISGQYPGTLIRMSLEGIIVLIFLATLAIIWRRHGSLPLKSPGSLVTAVLLMAAGQLFFIQVGGSNTVSSLIGHAYKTLAYAYLYRAMFLDNIREPLTRLKQTHQRLQLYTAQLDELLDNAPDGIMGVDRNGKIRFVNPALEKMFGYSARELLGESIEILLPIAQRDRHTQLRSHYLQAPSGRPMSSQRGLVGRCKDGREIPVDIALGKQLGADGVQITAFIRDVTERKKLEQDMQHRATHDLLTGLPNRALLHDRMDRAIAHARRHGSQFALIMIDLDNFKDVNDGWGHSLGDQLLVTVARRLQRALREGDTVARFGGDEFVILAADTEHPESALAIVQKIMDAMSNVFVLGNHQFHVSASIGVALFPAHADDAETLMSHADIAMYRAKNMGRSTACYFDDTMSLDQQEALLIKTRLHDALEQNQLQIHYQPQYRLADRQIIGFEALLRWPQPDESLIPPDVFIPIAEANGLIIPLTDYLITHVCDQIRQWSDAGHPIRVAVNISAMHFKQKGSLLHSITSNLARTGINPSLLGLELTETALMENADEVAEVLRQLVSMGIHVAMDDFGTGYSSLASLQLYPLHMLKIDRSFMQDLHASDKNIAIITGLVNLASSLGLEVLAEGVETLEQYRLLKNCNCDSFQGWLMSPALPAGQCTRLLAEAAITATSLTAGNSQDQRYQSG